MPQVNYTPIQLYRSGTTGNTPSASLLQNGELAINYADGKLFYKDGVGTVRAVVTPDGSVTTAKIVDANVTTAKIADANVTAAKLAAGAAVSNVGAGGITATQLASGSVTTAKFDASAKTPYAGAADTAATSTTRSNGDNSTNVATTAYVQNMGLGWSQTWQDVTSLRGNNTNYTNSTGKPIQVLVTLPDTGGATAYVEVVVDSVQIINVAYDIGGGAASALPSFIVPPNSTYRVNAYNGGSIARWAELR